MKLDILYEDNHIIVVKKIIGVLSQEDATGDLDMLTLIKGYLKEKYHKPGNVFLGLIHRLDRMVGGVMVFAKTSKGASRLSEQIRNHTFDKSYIAVVHGLTKKEDTLCDYLKKNVKNNIVYVADKINPEAKFAELSYNLIDYKNDLSLVNINLKTGRPHQIRVQFSHQGNPLVGDNKYGNLDEKLNIALFAYKLSFNHPITKKLLTFTIFPDDIYPFNLFKLPFEINNNL